VFVLLPLNWNMHIYVNKSTNVGTVAWFMFNLEERLRQSLSFETAHQAQNVDDDEF
jgi:hypothetical protein